MVPPWTLLLHGGSSGSPVFGVPENLKVKPLQTDKDEGGEGASQTTFRRK